MLKTIAVATAALLVITPASAQQYPTIVGEWYATEIGPQDCGTPHAFHIGPMHYVEEALSCEFQDVRRDGWKVTWNGSCNDGSSSSKTQVVALEESGSLSMWFNGKPGWTTLRRCDARTSDVQAPAVDRVHLTYTEYAQDTAVARQYWGDQIDIIAAAGVAAVPVTVRVASAAGYDFAYVDGGMICGMGEHGCPIRIYQDGRKLGEFSACEDLDQHAVAKDGSRFYACGTGEQGWLMSSLMQ